MKRSPLVILFITVVIDLLGFGIIFPLLPVYVQKFGGTPVVAGLLTTSFSIAQFIFSPIWGRASDRFGRRPLILLSLFGSAVAFLIFGLAVPRVISACPRTVTITCLTVNCLLGSPVPSGCKGGPGVQLASSVRGLFWNRHLGGGAAQPVY